MDPAGTAARHPPVDYRAPAPLYVDDTEDDDSGTDYVKWQGSQTTCSALNQLIRSSTLSDLRSADDEPTSRGWQRQPSFDQIPGFSRLSTTDTPEPAPSSSTSHSSSAKPLRPSLARPRSSTTAEPALPLLGSASPATFMDMLKGVSARLDRSVVGAGAPARGEKRVRRSSAGSAVEARPGRAKRGRVSAPQELEGRPRPSPFHGDDSPSKASGRPPGARDLESSRIVSRPGNPQASSSTSSASQSEMPPPALPQTSKQPDSAISPFDCGTRVSRLPPRTSDVEAASSRTNTRPGNTRPSSSKEIAPQSKMPPPAHPHNHKHPSPSSTATSTTASSSESRTTSAGPLSRTPSTVLAAAPKATPAPKLHPLLVAQQEKPTTKPATSIPTSQPAKQQQARAAPPSSTPRSNASQASRPTASQSSRPPALGMRRAVPTVAPAPKALPTVRKTFRPPLLAAQPPRPNPVAAPPIKHATPPFSSGSASSGSLRASTSSASSVPRSSSPPPSAPRAPSVGARPALPEPKFTTAAAALELEARAPSPVLPEPLDGDGDSSFGDMSFDMDALEETMRLYD